MIRDGATATPERVRRSWAVGSLAALALVLCVTSPALAQDEPQLAEGKVEAEVDRGSDAEIEARLRATYARFESLAKVEPDVAVGVVRLRGRVDSASARELAGKLAHQIEGVSAVVNQVEETRSVQRRLDLELDTLRERLWEVAEGVPLLLVALAILGLALLASRLLTAFDVPFRWMTANVFVQDLLRQVARLAVVVLGALLALEILDATALIGAVLGAAGVVGLALGFAFRDLVENYIASILLSLRQPFAPNDHIKVEGFEGKVARLTSRATQLVTFEGNHVRIPNALVYKSVIENFTRKPERRFSFSVGVGTDESLVAAQDVGIRVLRDMQGVLDEPEPFALVEALADSNVRLDFYGWVDQRSADFLKVRSEAIRLVKRALDAAGIAMPEPTQSIRLLSPEAVRPAPEGPAPPQVRDVAPDRTLDEAIREERTGPEKDLLSVDGASE